MYYFVSKTREIVTFVLCFLIAAGGAVFANIYGSVYLNLLPWNLDAAFYGLLFYAVGNSFKRHIGHGRMMRWVKDNGVKSVLLSLVLFVTLWILAMNFGECSMGSSSYQCAEWLFFVRAFIGCAWMILVSAMLCSISRLHTIVRPLKWCGMNSLDIMCLHVPIKGVAIVILTFLLHLSIDVSENAALSAVVFVLTVTACVIITLLINGFIRRNHNHIQ